VDELALRTVAAPAAAGGEPARSTLRAAPSKLADERGVLARAPPRRRRRRVEADVASPFGFTCRFTRLRVDTYGDRDARRQPPGDPELGDERAGVDRGVAGGRRAAERQVVVADPGEPAQPRLHGEQVRELEVPMLSMFRSCRIGSRRFGASPDVEMPP
jgi:hypothetical protein